MRIAYVNADPGVPAFGNKGCSIHIQEILRSFTVLGHTIELFSPRLGGIPPLDLESVKIHNLTEIPKCDIEVRENLAIKTNIEIYNALLNAGPFDLVYERYSLWNYSGMEYSNKQNIPGVLEINSPLLEEQQMYRKVVQKNIAENTTKKVLEYASSIIAVSYYVKDYFVRLYPGINDKIDVIYNGVNINNFRNGVLPALDDYERYFTIGFLGSLKPWHGISDLIQIFHRFQSNCNDSRLLIVGDGVERHYLDKVIDKYGLNQKVIVTGLINHNQVPGYLASMDVAIAPYPDNNNFYFSPLKIYEYMSSGLPIIASSVGQIKDIIIDGVNGILCEPGNYSRFVECISKLKENPLLRKKLSVNARNSVLNHSWDNVAVNILSTIKNRYSSRDNAYME